MQIIIEENVSFSKDEILQILRVKNNIKEKLKIFNLTIGKLGKDFTKSYYVTGGCVGSLLRGETPKDYDVYFLSKEKADVVINLYTKDPSYSYQVAEVEEKYRDVILPTGKGNMMITENATTLKDGIQLITKHYGEPSDVRNTFDFVHCKPYYDTRDDRLYISREQFDLNINKKLLCNVNKEFIEHWRIEKYMKRGFTWL